MGQWEKRFGLLSTVHNKYWNNTSEKGVYKMYDFMILSFLLTKGYIF